MYLLTPDRHAQLRELRSQGNPYVLYPEWYARNWPDGVDAMQGIGWYYLWASTGNQEALDKAKAFRAPYYGESGIYRQVGVYAIALGKLLEPHLTAERNIELRMELRDMMTSAIRLMRKEDGDERIVLVFMATMMDEFFGTEFLTAAEKNDTTSPYYTVQHTMPELLEEQQRAWRTDGQHGASSESIGYMVNTYNIILFAAACLKSKNSVPGFAEWLRKFKEFLLWIQSSDCKHTLTYGDAQESINEEYQRCLWYRLPLLWLMVGLGEDEDGRLADLAVRFAESKAGGRITKPEQLHYILNWGAYLVTDFSKIPLDGPRTELEEGFRYFHPGLTIWRNKTTFYYCIGTAPVSDDHDSYAGGGSRIRLYHKDHLVIADPGGYSNHWTELNGGAALRGHSFLWDRGTDLAEVAADGKIHTKYHQRGPMPSHVWSSPPSFDFVGHEWILDVSFDPVTLKIEATYNWKHDGKFPTYPQYYYPWMFAFKPFECQICAMPGLTIDGVDKQLKWVSSGGIEVSAAYSGAEGVETVPWIFRGIEHFKLFRLQSERNVGSHSFTLTLGEAVDVPPDLPPLQYGDEPVPDDQLLPVNDLLIVDNKSPGYHTLGQWIRYPDQGIDGDVDYAIGGDGSLVAVWRAVVYKGATYNVATVWTPYTNRATNSPFVVKLNGVQIAYQLVNQELAPASFQDEFGMWWHTLTDITVAEDGILSVELNNKADDHVIADAIRFEKLVAPVPPDEPQPPVPELQLPLSFDQGKYTVLKDAQGEICLIRNERAVFTKDSSPID